MEFSDCKFACILLGNGYVSLLPTEKNFSNDFVYQSIHCDCFDIIRIKHFFPKSFIFVDDMGWYKSPTYVNLIASYLYGTNIVGDCLLVSDDAPNCYAFPFDIANMLVHNISDVFGLPIK